MTDDKLNRLEKLMESAESVWNCYICDRCTGDERIIEKQEQKEFRALVMEAMNELRNG